MADVNLNNTPGICYAIAYWVFALLYTRLVPQRQRGWRRWLIQAGVLVFLAVLMAVTDGLPKAFFIPLILLIFAFLCFFIYTVSEVDLKKAVYLCVRAYILAEFAASLEWQFFYFEIRRGKLELTLTDDIFFMLVIYGIIWVVMNTAEKRFGGNYARLELSKEWITLVLLIGTTTFAASNLSYVLKNSPFSSQYPAEIFLIRSLFDILGVVTLFAGHILHLKLEEERRAQAMAQVIRQQTDNYRMAEESVELVSRKYHDLKHQIAILKNHAGTGGSMKYLDQMEQEIRQFEALKQTGNEALDTVLTAKSITCQKEEIHIMIMADGRLLDFMDPLDLGALFGNAMDNAIEASREIPDPAGRQIRVNVSRWKQFARIVVENRFAGELQFEDGYPRTTKAQGPGYHGYGVRSMEYTAEKYGGSMRTSTGDGWFRLRFLIPLPSEEHGGREMPGKTPEAHAEE